MKTLAWLALAAGAATAHAASIDNLTLQRYVERELAGVGARVEVAIGEIDSRRALAPCARVEPFVPPSARLWGRTSIGVRCVEGARWTTLIPVQVRVFGPALVATRPLPPGKVLTASDYRVAEVELSRAGAVVLVDPSEARDRVLVRPLAAGQPLQAGDLRAQPVVAPGDVVRVVHRGAGFSVSTEGKSLGSAAAGQSVRVQTESGRVVSGTAAALRVVEVLVAP